MTNTQRQSETCDQPKQSQLALPLYKVILHNDDYNGMGFVVKVLQRLFHLPLPTAQALMLEAHRTGCVIIVIEGFEVAEFHRDQLRSFGLTASIEPV